MRKKKNQKLYLNYYCETNQHITNGKCHAAFIDNIINMGYLKIPIANNRTYVL